MSKGVERYSGVDTYVALTSSFAGTGGIVEVAIVEDEELFVACAGALFGGDFLRLRNPIVSVDAQSGV